MKIDNKFFKSPNDIFDYNLSEHEIIVYLYLCRCGNNKEFAYPSYSTIAKKCGMNKRTAQRAIEDLLDRKLIKKENRFKNNEQLSNNFSINMPKSTLLKPVDEKPKHIRESKKQDKLMVSSDNGMDTQSLPMDRESLPIDTQSLGVVTESHPGIDRESPKEELNKKNYIKKNKEEEIVEEEQNLAGENKKIESIENIINAVNEQHNRTIEELKNTPSDLEFSNSYDRLLKLNAFRSYKEKIKPTDSEISEMTQLLNKYGEGKLSVALGEALMAFINKSTEDYFGVFKERLISLGG
jgi:DNA-binding transcriptional MocR family regulator